MAIEKSTRLDFKHFTPLQTRWSDNDAYQHINNVVYYSFFDTIVNKFLIRSGLLNIQKSNTIGLVVETTCRYFAPLEFPQDLEGALRVGHLGNSSIRYELGIFEKGSSKIAAEGHFIHVYVDATTRKPTALPDEFRSVLQPLML